MASRVVNDLISYAEPPAPKMAPPAVGQISDESIPLAGHKSAVEQINAQVHISPEVKDVLMAWASKPCISAEPALSEAKGCRCHPTRRT